MNEKILQEISQKYNELLKTLPSDIPQQLLTDFKFAFIGCYLKKYPDIPILHFAKVINMDDTTLGRFKRKIYTNHKKIWNFIEKSNFCKNFSFDDFMLDKLKQLSASTISKKKFYYRYYKKFLNENKLDVLKIKRISKNSFKIIDTNKKKNNIKQFNDLVDNLKNTFKRKKRNIHIIAFEDSEPKIKQLAKDFGCEIQERTNKFKREDDLVFSINPGKYYH